MATRPVFIVSDSKPYFEEIYVDFNWNKGLNIRQRQKNVVAIHTSFHEAFPEKKVLEISSKSLQPEGLPLSAFRLEKYVKSLGKKLPVELIYQGGKIFENGGPYLDLYDAVPIKAKKDVRLHSLGHVTGFWYEGEKYPIEHYDAFYNWIYIQALIENPDLSKPLLDYDAFTDVAYCQNSGTSCQARSAAIYVSLFKNGNLGCISDYYDFINTLY